MQRRNWYCSFCCSDNQRQIRFISIRSANRTGRELKDFRAVLARARERKNLSRRDLAAPLNRPRSVVGLIESNQRQVTIQEFVAIAEAIDTGYRRLVNHWLRNMPESTHQVSYEHLVEDSRGEAGQLLDFCGLAWEDACLDFHLNLAATMTASAFQVRQPLYDTSVQQWRHFEAQPERLRRQLKSMLMPVPTDRIYTRSRNDEDCDYHWCVQRSRKGVR